MRRALRILALAAVAIRDESFSGPGGPQPLRLYTPAGEGPFPVIVWIHRGGFWMGEQPVTLERFDGAIHGFLGSPDDMAASG
jgi:acetyl esterase